MLSDHPFFSYINIYLELTLSKKKKKKVKQSTVPMKIMKIISLT